MPTVTPPPAAAPPVAAAPAPSALVDVLPVLVALVPLGWALGVATAASPLGGGATGWAGGPLLVSGAAHFAFLSEYAGAGAVAAVATALAISTRALVFGAALAPRLRDQPRWFRAVVAYLLVDQMFVLADGWIRRGARGGVLRRAFLTAGAALWVTWIAAITGGMLAGPVVPGAWRVELVLPALLAGMLVPAVSGRGARAAGVAALVAMLAGPLPAGLGVVVPTLAGVAAAWAGRDGTA